MTTFLAKNLLKTGEQSENGSAQKNFETKSIHSGLSYREQTGSVIPPIYMTSTFESGNEYGFDYTRSGNPNFKNLESTIASLEEADYATVFASGVSAITAVLSTLKSGDLIICEENVYGCTYRLLEQVFRKFGIEVVYLDFSETKNFKFIEESKPKLIWIESPTNPLLKIIDISEVSALAEKVDATLVVDNTFASSYFQKPLTLGATLSLSSTTKYLNGHSDCIGGVVCTNDPAWQEKLIFAQKAVGLNPSPFDSWLVSRGIKTMALRMQKHQENSLRIANYLEDHNCFKNVRYPFLPTHPQYELAKRQMTGGSGIITTELNLSFENTIRFLKKLSLFTLAESLGGVESLICHPASMTHAAIPKEMRLKIGITDTLIRFSVGIENIEDLINDIEQAL